MLKSLFSGVSGLQSHQIAMDVESNNIANVNTIGFKYSRANFSDLLAQTNQISTAPQGSLGGKNAVQVGLGATVASVTRLHSQGSIQNTDKNTDLAIQGDGFFIISPDGGNTYKYTRSGDFKFDANGNLVDNNGFISQGWLRDEVTGLVDSTAPIQNIVIAPGLTTPANSSTEVVLKSNLNAGSTITESQPAYALNAAGAFVDANGNIVPFDIRPLAEDMGVLFNASGEAFNLKDGQGISISVDGGATFTDIVYAAAGDGVADDQTFQTVNGLREELVAAYAAVGIIVDVTVGADGKFNISNTTGAAITTQIVDIAGNPNLKFADNFTTLNGTTQPAANKSSQAINAATHASSIDVYDSLGSKHTVRIEFRKTGNTNGSEWSYTVTVPKPGSLNNAAAPNENILTGGNAQFTDTGALAGFNIPSIDFTANNGSAPNQNITLDFGTINGFDGLTSFDNPSATSGISQDGFPGGDLLGIRIDQSGTLVGSFTNGRSFGLAQVSMAKFTNNEGLTADGGNVYIQSANSGDPIIGTAATAGRGFIQSAALEASNVDLSRSLTQLIIIQRGYQANGKTITTSDQLLNTLINLKN
ncbi:MAG TPA: flagellar hook-basal body complex protein [Sulfurimonas sp.]|nr:flagellar hook-basal body complex protein [Sulfurimonas sp.]